MPYNILLLPLLGGFVFITRWYRTRWYAQRAEKERLIIYAALAGVAHLGIAFLVVFLFNTALPLLPCLGWLPNINRWWTQHVPFPYSGTAVIAFSVGLFGWMFLNWIADKRTGNKGSDIAAARIIRDCGGPLEHTLYKSVEEEKHVMLTLTNGKVYVGRIADTFIPDDEVIFLFPTKSGYRDQKQRLDLTTHYDEAYLEMAENELDYKSIMADFRIAIPVERLVSASLYLDDIHAKYFPHDGDARPERPAVEAPVYKPNPKNNRRAR